MTPAIVELERARLEFRVHRFKGDPNQGYAVAAAEALGVSPRQVFKTLMVTNGRDHAVGIVPASGSLNLKHMAKSCGWKKAQMAAPADAERLTGYLVGGISPLGQKKRLARWLDTSAGDWPTVFISGGQRGLDIELAPQALLACGVKLASIADA
ncbi:Cys-tRNA(Pro) deacylase [Litorivicinus lipolyticus]|uniref:Cys-tRNA(Pro)/Cys-tRNA(Cys) deacylase n=1 Tax=Litorivicinus lipolyticus TaxID=418701 RepID=A0A5Q2QBA1_9GAMM|nr:Cys-tRNA(Pro) deacylase [Litorivicinus lipolyticus]QGG80563.1 Cys-tRNA(Pro) deacylase [Litorivicinus lipolyticus]